MTPQAAHVHPETEYVAVRNGQGMIVRRYRFLAPKKLLSQHGDAGIAGAQLQNAISNCAKRDSLIKDIVYQQYGSIADARRHIAPPLQDSTGHSIAVAAGIHVIELQRERQFLEQSSTKKKASAHDNQYQWIGATNILRYR